MTRIENLFRRFVCRFHLYKQLSTQCHQEKFDTTNESPYHLTGPDPQ